MGLNFDRGERIETLIPSAQVKAFSGRVWARCRSSRLELRDSSRTSGRFRSRLLRRRLAERAGTGRAMRLRNMIERVRRAALKRSGAKRQEWRDFGRGERI